MKLEWKNVFNTGHKDWFGVSGGCKVYQFGDAKEIEAKQKQLAQLEEQEANSLRNMAIKPLHEFTPEEKVAFFDEQYNNVITYYLKPIEDEGYVNEDDEHYAWEELMVTVARNKDTFWKYFNSLCE